MENICAVHEKPMSEREPVGCGDEEPVVLQADLRPPLAMRHGRRLRHDSEYDRRGTNNTFYSVESKAGRRFSKVTPNRSSPEFVDYLLKMAEHDSPADTIRLVMDDPSSHTRKAPVERFGQRAGGWPWGRSTVYYTPALGSWLIYNSIRVETVDGEEATSGLLRIVAA